MQRYLLVKYNRGMKKRLNPPFSPRKLTSSSRRTIKAYFLLLYMLSFIMLFSNIFNGKSKRFCWKIQNSFRRNRSRTLQILTLRQIIERVRAKNFEATHFFVDFSKTFDSIHGNKIDQILAAYALSKDTITAIMMLYTTWKQRFVTGWRHRQFLHYCWRFAWRYFRTILIYNLHKLRTCKVGRSNKRKWL